MPRPSCVRPLLGLPCAAAACAAAGAGCGACPALRAFADAAVAAPPPALVACVGTASAVACERPRTPEAARSPASLRMGTALVELEAAAAAAVLAVPEKK
jgi:hypothetical protein